MNISTLSSEGQITIPLSIRIALGLRAGDSVAFHEENGRFYFDNASLAAFSRIEQEFQGTAKEAGFSSETDMQDYMLQIRQDVRGY